MDNTGKPMRLLSLDSAFYSCCTVNGQTYSIIDSKAIKYYKKATKDLQLFARRYDWGYENIPRCHLTALKLIFIEDLPAKSKRNLDTQAMAWRAEKVTLVGKSKFER